jgi:hypothetical protein
VSPSRTKRSKLLAAALFASLLPGRPALAGDLGTAQRKIQAARYQVDNNTQEAQDDLDAATQELEGLDDATRGPLLQEITELRKQIVAKRIASALDSVRHALERTESNWKEGGDRRDDALIERNYASLAEQLGALPQDDPDVKATLERLAKSRAEYSASLKKGDRDRIVGNALKRWQETERRVDLDSATKETAPPSAQDFLRKSHVATGCEGCRELLDKLHASFFSKPDVVAAAKSYAGDPDWKPVLERATQARDAARGQICATANRLMDSLDSVDASSVEGAVGRAHYLVETVEEAVAAPAGAATLSRAQALEKKWADQQSRAKGAAAERAHAIEASCDPFWAEAAKSFGSGFVELDPLDCVKNPGRWRGKRVRFTNVDNHLKGEYWDDGTYGFIVKVNGSPVALTQDPGLVEAIRQAQKVGNVALSPWPDTVEDAIGIVEGVCVVEGRFYSSITKQESKTGASWEAPLVRVTSLKQAPLAFVEGKGTNLSRVPGLPDVPVAIQGKTASSASEGGGWFFTVVLGLFCFGVSVVAVGGAIGAVIYFRKKSSGEST